MIRCVPYFVHQMDSALLAAADEDQLAHATQPGRVLVTYQRPDFLRHQRIEVLEEQSVRRSVACTQGVTRKVPSEEAVTKRVRSAGNFSRKSTRFHRAGSS